MWSDEEKSSKDEDNLLYVEYHVCPCKKDKDGKFYINCNNRQHDYIINKNPDDHVFVFRCIESHLNHIEMQLQQVTKNHYEWIKSLQERLPQIDEMESNYTILHKRLTQMEKRLLELNNTQERQTLMEKQLIELNDAVKYIPNGEVYNECKKEFEELNKQL